MAGPGLPGELAERFETERVLGKGGMGIVLLARDRELDRKVAIKLASGPASEAFALRFMREARTLAALKHGRIPRIFSFGLAGTCPWLVQEYVAGKSLADGARPVDPIACMVALAEALGTVHAAGLVHRDVKPGNVVLDEEGRPYLVDFGLVFDPMVSRLTQTSERVGTASYMAPEGLVESEPAPAQDWFGWGATFYYLFAGRAPFKVQQILDAALGAPLPPPDFGAVGVPGPVAGLLARCLDREPENRPRDFEEIGAALRGDPSSSTVPAVAEPPPARPALPAPRPPRRGTGWVYPALFGVAVAIGALTAPGKPEPPGPEPLVDPGTPEPEPARVERPPAGSLVREESPSRAIGVGSAGSGSGSDPAEAEEAKPVRATGIPPITFGATTLARWKLEQIKGPEDVAEVERLLAEAAIEDPREGRSRYAQWFLDGRHRPVDAARGVAELETAIRAGSSKARILMANMLAKGTLVRADFPRALRLLDEASAERHGEALRVKALLYRDGVGTPADPVKAAELMFLAFKRGDLPGAYLFALMLRSGAGVPADPVEAERIMTELANMGYLPAIGERSRATTTPAGG